MSVFYDNLRQQFEYLRVAQLQLDKCVNNLTGLMEQAAHMCSDVADVPPLVAEEGPAVPDGIFQEATHNVFAGTNQIEFSPLPTPAESIFNVGHSAEAFRQEPRLDIDTAPTSPPWPMPGSNVPFMTPIEGVEEVMVNDAPMLGLEVRSHTLPNPVAVSYEGNVSQPSFGTVTYE